MCLYKPIHSAADTEPFIYICLSKTATEEVCMVKSVDKYEKLWSIYRYFIFQKHSLLRNKMFVESKIYYRTIKIYFTNTDASIIKTERLKFQYLVWRFRVGFIECRDLQRWKITGPVDDYWFGVKFVSVNLSLIHI